MREEKPKTFKLQKTVSTRQHGWTALISLILGIIFFSSVIGVILLVLGIVSGIIWLVRIVKERKNKVHLETQSTTKSHEDRTEKSDTLKINKKDIKKFALLIAAVVLIGIGISIYQAIQENNDRHDEIQSGQYRIQEELEYQNCLTKQLTSRNGGGIYCDKPSSLDF
ncbi:MAG: hypothetical protein WC451_02355 [Patescibacteria group bacterium]